MSDKVTIPRPHVPFGPLGVPEMLADADYLDHAARSIAGGYAVGGYNVTHTVIDLLHSVATALRDAHAAEVRSTDTAEGEGMSDDELLETYRAAVNRAMSEAHARDGFASNMSRESIVAGLRAVFDIPKGEGN